MEKFFKARSVAVIGVTPSPTNMGRAMVMNLLEFRYQGTIYLVGPKGGTFLGHKIYRSVKDVPDPVELAALLVPARAVPGLLKDLGEIGVSRVVVESAGFRELGDDRRILEEEILKVCRRYGMRLIGPNCIGIINRHTGLAVPFMPMKAEAPPGRLAIVSQSGGVGAMMVNECAAENIGFSKFASIGNKLDVNENDLLEYLNRDEQTDVIYCYLEGIADGRKLMEKARQCSKPIIVHKSNRGRSGSMIARSHSASLATDDEVVSSALRQVGIIRVQDQKEGLLAAKAFHLPPMRGRRLVVISRSGGHAVMAADAADEWDFTLPPLNEDLIRLVQKRARAGVIRFHNPLDLGDVFDFDLYRRLVQINLQRKDVDGVLFIHNYQGIVDRDDSRRLIMDVGALMADAGKPVAICVCSVNEEISWYRRRCAFPVFEDPREAVMALAWNRDNALRRPLASEAIRRPGKLSGLPLGDALESVKSGPLEPRLLAKALEAYGIPLVPWAVVETLEDAVMEIERLGLPVALKAADPEILHKTDVGAVFLNLSNETEVRKAFHALSSLSRWIMVQKMGPEGVEWIVGGRQDETFGPVVVSGLGGIFVEVLKESSLRVAPMGKEEADDMLDECRGSALLSGIRGKPACRRDLLVDLIERVSWFLYDHPQIVELDLNPVRVTPAECVVLDWRAVVEKERRGSEADHEVCL